jgi:hypothetical protein
MAEISFLPIGRFDEMLKAVEQAPFCGPSILDRPGLPDPSQGLYGYRNGHKGFHLFGSFEYFIGKTPEDLKIFPNGTSGSPL